MAKRIGILSLFVSALAVFSFIAVSINVPATISTLADAAINPSWSNCSGGYVALTYDDGPSAEFTGQTLTRLKNENMHATFFVLGEHVVDNPKLTKQIFAGGHAVGNHTWDHESLLSLTKAGVNNELNSTSNAIGRYGPRPTLFRPPYGDTNASIATSAKNKGMIEVGWTVDTNDWQGKSPEQIASFVDTIQPGGIVLMHDNNGNTEAAIPLISKKLQARKMCPGRIVYDATGQKVWDGWTTHVKAVRW